MTVGQLAEKLQGRLLGGSSADAKVSGGYAGDFLSHCMVRVKEGGAWFTVMNNVNVAAVASLCGAACVVLCEGTLPDDALKSKSESAGICLIVTPLPVFEACVASGL